MAVPIQPRHICLLFRRFLHFGDDVTRPYVDALEARGVPHLLVGGKSFHDREEVETMRAALAAIEWPDDELSVFATLRGRAVRDRRRDAARMYRHRHRSLHPFRVPADVAPESLRPIADALALLRAAAPPAQLPAGRRHDHASCWTPRARTSGFVLRPAGEQALANVLHVAELARQYEPTAASSFRGFVEELRDQADGGQAAEAPILEEGSDGVRLMTVHKAKGLEFPVVILADMTAKLRSRSRRPARSIARRTPAPCASAAGRRTSWRRHEAGEIARDEAEGVRLAYVAATRARDLLVVPAVGDADGTAAGRRRSTRRSIRRRIGGATPAPAAGCPAFKKDSVWRRPDNDPATPQTVCPGQHRRSDAGTDRPERPAAPYGSSGGIRTRSISTSSHRPASGARR